MDFDDDSDLTDIEDGYEDEVKKKPKSGSTSKAGRSTYRIKNALRVPRATTYTAQALYDQIHNADINLEPEYQRDVVWPETKQIGIIDSIFRNFYIPPVIFAANVADDGSETKTCIDGKQRLTSIHRFMDGLIPHKDSITAEKWWYIDANQDAKKPRKILPEKLRKSFANKQIVCVEYQEITDNDEREIFQRVQLGMALTPAEKLQVISTSRSTFIRELLNEHLRDGGLSADSLEWEVSRGADFRCLAQALWCIDKYETTELKNAGTILQLEKWLSMTDELSPTFRAKISGTYRIFSTLVQDLKLGVPFKKPSKVSPVEFIMISLLIAVHKDKLTVVQLSSAIGQMRDHVRKQHVDIRMNNRVAKTMIDFINDLKTSKVDGDIRGVAGSSSLKGKASEKRKRSSSDDNGNDEYQPKSKKGGYTSVLKAEKVGIPAKASKPIVALSIAKPSAVAIDRMAALRAAKDSIAQNRPPARPSSSQNVPTGPRSMTVPEFAQNPHNPPTPQMLPSPGQSFAFPSALVSSANFSQLHSVQQMQMQATHQLPPSNLLDSSLMAAALRPNTHEGSHGIGSTPSAPSRSENVGPPPLSAASSAGGSRYSDYSYRDQSNERGYRFDDRGGGWYRDDQDGWYGDSERGLSRGGGRRGDYGRVNDSGWPSRR